MVRMMRTRLARAVGATMLASAAVRLVAGQYESSPRTSRRDFLRWTVAGASVFFLAEAATGFVAFFWPIKIGRFGQRIALRPEEIPAPGAPPIVNREGKFWLIHNEDGALALYWKCVHLGCTVPWIEGEGRFHCNCHGSIYDRHGVRVAGPAPRPLDMMAIEVGDGGVVVDTSQIIQRTGYEPGQATRLPS